MKNSFSPVITKRKTPILAKSTDRAYIHSSLQLIPDWGLQWQKEKKTESLSHLNALKPKKKGRQFQDIRPQKTRKIPQNVLS